MEIDIVKVLQETFKNTIEKYELPTGMTLAEAVEKQIPKKPVIPFDSINQEYECPVCPHWVYKNQQYCDQCGQALEW